MSETAPTSSRKRRHSKACTRCRKRKIRCDFQFPTCGACTQAAAPCLGFDSIRGVDKPRSTISHLEEEIARLEIELGQIRSPTKTTADIANAAAEGFSTRLAAAMLAPRGPSRKQGSLLPLNSPFFLTESPVPFVKINLSDLNQDVLFEEPLPVTNKLSSIPRHVIDAMLKHYCEIYRPLYPSIDEANLYEACERVYNNISPSAFDIFSVHITLAISMQTLMHKDEKRATTASTNFWTTAADLLDQVGTSDPWERLQALQLCTHYAFMNPKAVDCSKCAPAATRLCLQIGLHHELPASNQANLDSKALQNRRRLFWNSYNIDAAIDFYKFPDSGSQPSPTHQFLLLRQLESEITMAMYYPDLSLEDAPWKASFGQWYTSVQERMNAWYQTTRQSINLGEKIEFHEMLFQCQILRLNRPSPRFPRPSKEMNKKTLQISIALIKEYATVDRMGKLFNIWHAAYYIFESGVCLIAMILTGLESSEQDHRILMEEDVTILMKYIKILPSLLWKISRRWPGVAPHASTIDSLCAAILVKLEERASGGLIWDAEFYAVKDKVSQLLLFSPMPAGAQATLIDESQAVEAELPPPSDGHSLSMDLGVGFNPSHSQDLTTGAVPFYPDWSLSEANLDPSSLVYPDPYGFSDGDALSWDFAGMDSDEILAALLAEAEPLMLNDVDATTIPGG
ncbi:hypothetical protein LTR10_019536 [Elasticomyces elasticus]|uniref:Zn(2)-C6 fungal-type domain-containing protein n=1 Tax=Exophiala sideris TaxID=1016849 RepID=A0ABR0J5S0_9EURO|nr:hypothetical protein LTR10_019536 [Elasticomyces elasticus]KAK5028501.1 hypothetical protein LTS07_006592 [Exophiala sideris]KAK5035857.1 hypothetical protein LTR13_005427 [Exophiala sideris]KAK5056893.1 hypothetical protein LTR69_007531 [Exophiala sideris]KAK5181300.1 hypothetical protein LTR44_006095 [Eurotiomycetes sp. CCFEE 6388]